MTVSDNWEMENGGDFRDGLVYRLERFIGYGLGGD